MLYAKFMYPNNGYPSNKEAAKKAGLQVGEKYEVENISMGQSYCSIYLKDIEGSFNSVQFEYEKDGKPYDIFDDPKYNPYLNIKFVNPTDNSSSTNPPCGGSSAVAPESKSFVTNNYQVFTDSFCHTRCIGTVVSSKPSINFNLMNYLDKYEKFYIDVDNVKNLIFSVKDKSYVLDFQKPLEDYGIEVKE